jgi:hypothetical protein
MEDNKPLEVDKEIKVEKHMVIPVVLVLIILSVAGYIYYVKFYKPTQANPTASQVLESQPTPKDPKEEVMDFYLDSRSASVDSEILEINDCVATPAGMRIYSGDDLVMKNTGRTLLEIRFSTKEAYDLAPQETVTAPNFKGGKSAIYYYRCNGSVDAIGYVNVE